MGPRSNASAYIIERRRCQQIGHLDSGRCQMKTSFTHSPKRRDSLKQIAVLSGLLAGLGYSSFAVAAYNKAAFDSKSVNEAIKLQGGGTLAESKEVLLNAPDYAENGAAVALGVSTALPGVRKILILVEKILPV